MTGEKRKLIIAIDGFSSTGKSTYAKLIARELGYSYVDTGAMYRAVTLYCIEKGLFNDTDEPDKERVIELLPEIDISFRRNPRTGKNETCLGTRAVEEEIRSMHVSGHVSYISTIPQVREKMVAIQREMGKKGGIVMDGRDIGTVVYPDADIKIFMTAAEDVRAERRRKELEDKGVLEDFAAVLENIKKRDRIDSGREASPLKQADDAVLLDNSHMSLEDQMRWFHEVFKSILEKEHHEN